MSARHNHSTRDIKPFGQCPACDLTHVKAGTSSADNTLRERLNVVASNHPDPRCQVHDGDGVTCGWKLAYTDVLNALERGPEA